MEPLGLIAGEGVFPVLVARGARAAGRKVVCAAFAGHAWADLAADVDRMEWVGLLRFNQWIRVLRRAGCREAVMVGRVEQDPDVRPLALLPLYSRLALASRLIWRVCAARRPPAGDPPGAGQRNRRRGHHLDRLHRATAPTSSPPPAS